MYGVVTEKTTIWMFNAVKVSNFRHRLFYVGFEVLTAVVMKSTIFWDITPCSPLTVNRSFGGTYRLHVQGRKNKLNLFFRPSSGSKNNLFFRPWRWKRYVPPRRPLTLNGLHGVISQNIVLITDYFLLWVNWMSSLSWKVIGLCLHVMWRNLDIFLINI
jgi:hypothetical protein